MTTRPHSQLRVVTHECDGVMCAVAGQGHELSPILERVAIATPSKWVDATVVSAEASGRVVLALLADDSRVALWNHGDLSGLLEPGHPVSLHSVYDVLSSGATKLAVVRLVDAA